MFAIPQVCLDTFIGNNPYIFRFGIITVNGQLLSVYRVISEN